MTLLRSVADVTWPVDMVNWERKLDRSSSATTHGCSRAAYTEPLLSVERLGGGTWRAVADRGLLMVPFRLRDGCESGEARCGMDAIVEVERTDDALKPRLLTEATVGALGERRLC